jgi:salicylate 5-hydroxylase small subunit
MSADTLLGLVALNAEYAAVLDNGDFSRWPDLFTEDAVYRLQSRENFDRGLPLATLSFESRGMLKDRVYGAAETIFHDPYYQRHVIGLPRVLAHSGDGADGRPGLRCECNYVVLRTRRDAMPEVLSVGRYIDRVVQTPEGLRFAERLAIFDNDLIANSIIYPI